MAFFSIFLVLTGVVLVMLLIASAFLLAALIFLIMWRARCRQTDEFGRKKRKVPFIFFLIFVTIGILLAVPPSLMISGAGNQVLKYEIKEVAYLAAACQLPDFSAMGTAEEFTYDGQVYVSIDELSDPSYDRLETIGYVQQERPDPSQFVSVLINDIDTVLPVETIHNAGNFDLIHIHHRNYCLKSEKQKVLDYYQGNALYKYFANVIENDQSNGCGGIPITDSTYVKLISTADLSNTGVQYTMTNSDRHYQIDRYSSDGLYKSTIDLRLTDTEVYVMTPIDENTFTIYPVEEDLAWTVRHAIDSLVYE